MKRKYSRTTLRRIIKGKRELKIAKSADIAVRLVNATIQTYTYTSYLPSTCHVTCISGCTIDGHVFTCMKQYVHASGYSYKVLEVADYDLCDSPRDNFFEVFRHYVWTKLKLNRHR